MPGILSRFRRKSGRKSVVEFPPLAPEEDFTAIGDIHGRYDLMHRLIGRLLQGSDTCRLVFLGDYIDRGEQSAEVLEALYRLESASDRVTCLRGNHEDMLLGFLESPLDNGPRWLQNGGRQTLLSFGIAPVHPGSSEAEWFDVRDSLQSRMGSGMIDWVGALPAIWQSGNVAAVHAAADPDLPLHAQDQKNLIWGHQNFFQKPRQDGNWIIHGHTIVDEVMAHQGRIGVDTGAFATGRLSAVTITRGNIRVLTA